VATLHPSYRYFLVVDVTTPAGMDTVKLELDTGSDAFNVPSTACCAQPVGTRCKGCTSTTVCTRQVCVTSAHYTSDHCSLAAPRRCIFDMVAFQGPSPREQRCTTPPAAPLCDYDYGYGSGEMLSGNTAHASFIVHGTGLTVTNAQITPIYKWAGQAANDDNPFGIFGWEPQAFYHFYVRSHKAVAFGLCIQTNAGVLDLFETMPTLRGMRYVSQSPTPALPGGYNVRVRSLSVCRHDQPSNCIVVTTLPATFTCPSDVTIKTDPRQIHPVINAGMTPPAAGQPWEAYLDSGTTELEIPAHLRPNMMAMMQCQCHATPGCHWVAPIPSANSWGYCIPLARDGDWINQWPILKVTFWNNAAVNIHARAYTIPYHGSTRCVNQAGFNIGANEDNQYALGDPFYQSVYVLHRPTSPTAYRIGLADNDECGGNR